MKMVVHLAILIYREGEERMKRYGDGEDRMKRRWSQEGEIYRETRVDKQRDAAECMWTIETCKGKG